SSSSDRRRSRRCGPPSTGGFRHPSPSCSGCYLTAFRFGTYHPDPYAPRRSPTAMSSETAAADWKKTACILCSVNCGIEVQTGGDDHRHITKIRGDDAHPASQGYVCEKSQRMDWYQNGADRLTSPMRRKADGSYEAIGWDTAIREIADKFAAVKAQHGGESFL